MPKLYDKSQAPAPASDDLLERLKDAANDDVLLRKAVESSDVASIAAAITLQLAGCSFAVTNDSKLRRKTLNRPCPRTPRETFVEVLMFADRDTLDAMQLACRFLREIIQDLESIKLPLRSISQVNIGGFKRQYGDCTRSHYGTDCWYDYWLPVVEVVRDSNIGETLFPETVNQLVPNLRLAYCESVCIDLSWSPGLSTNIVGLNAAQFSAISSCRPRSSTC